MMWLSVYMRIRLNIGTIYLTVHNTIYICYHPQYKGNLKTLSFLLWEEAVDLYKTNTLKIMLFFRKLTGYPCFSLLLRFPSRYPIRQQLALLPSCPFYLRPPSQAGAGGGRRRGQRGSTMAGHPPPQLQPPGVPGRAPLSVGHG